MSVGYYMIWACMCVCIRMQIWINKLPNIWDMSVCVCMILYAAIHTHTPILFIGTSIWSSWLHICATTSRLLDTSDFTGMRSSTIRDHFWNRFWKLISFESTGKKWLMLDVFAMVTDMCRKHGNWYEPPKPISLTILQPFVLFFKCEWAFPCPVSPAWLFLVRCVCGQSHSQTIQYILHVHQTVERDTPFQKPIPWLLKDAKAIKTIAANLPDFLLNLPLWG